MFTSDGRSLLTANANLCHVTKFPFTFAPCKGIRIPESVKILLVESRIRETFACGIRNTAQGIQNPSSCDKCWNQEPGIRNPRCEIQNPRLS